ncbi:RNA-binding protein 34 isoform X2 [Canis lupus familiaris]|uniref:RNA binding motif protein 34 n=1 Tax=Canis lupus familiaris TaxID=9615 RepID=A0A8C0MH79_CANLF|nr:RNA-binding protein 34 isoform X2 [Canis lupus familiaris]XP_025304300.1 RNA-binding protein 34 isoform X2 [Canis lupus dingo]XP_038389800.1 RNA-binding protein 34 isoform X2 [Canis lupus familiaris]XP_038518424.1 RNA-binding protein 34 isoform X2 [Canis lupus familiaris]|eukprot:XP_022273113.1 RNA-binding protein 34 isoform X2 [Canis lupus familiaris]
MRMLVEGKNKRKKKGGAEEGERPDDDVRGTLTGDYVVGQVARSLFQGRRPSGDSAARLASLFSSSEPQLQPVYVPVPRETTTKRKRDEEEESTSQIQRPLLQEPSKSVKAKKKLSDAHKRKNTLASRDLEEEIHQKQEQKRNNFQSGINVADKKVLDVDHIVLNQRKKIEINQEEEKLKNERTVFVGNLPVTCNKKIPAEGTLSKKLAAIKRKIHPDQKYINAYVVFKDESSATKALKRNGAQIADGFRIRVDLASETSSRDKRSVFVGNLPYKVEESAVEEHFLDCGSIVAVRIVRDRVTGVGRGFGYVLFENTDAVHLALKLNNSELMGRKLRVMRSVNKEKLKPNSNPSLKNVGKPKEGLNSASKNVGLCKNLFIGEKAVLIKKKKKKGQKKSGHTKKQKKQK